MQCESPPEKKEGKTLASAYLCYSLAAKIKALDKRMNPVVRKLKGFHSFIVLPQVFFLLGLGCYADNCIVDHDVGDHLLKNLTFFGRVGFHRLISARCFVCALHGYNDEPRHHIVLEAFVDRPPAAHRHCPRRRFLVSLLVVIRPHVIRRRVLALGRRIFFVPALQNSARKRFVTT